MRRLSMADGHEAKASPSPLDTVGALQALGAELRSARLERGLSLPDVVARLHLRPEQLEALEAADAADLPEPVYVIAQAQHVGSFLGLDTEPLITPLRTASAASSPRSAPWTKPLVTGPPASTGTDRFRALTQRDSGSAKHNRRRAPAGSFPTGPLLKGAVLLAALGSGALILLRDSSGNAPVAAPASERQPARTPERPAATATQLVLRSTTPSWMEVRGSDGATLFRGTFSGEKSFPLGGGLDVLAGRPDLVIATLASRPAARLRPIDQVKWHRFGPDGLR